MNKDMNVERFESLMYNVHREGIDELMEFIRNSDFYEAPSSTKFHLCCSGGLLQHSLNVYDALVSSLRDNGDTTMSYLVNGQEVARVNKDSLIVMSLLHDLCKTSFYAKDYKNQKTYDPEKVSSAPSWQVKSDTNGKFIWETVEIFVVNDQNPYGHGEKSVMFIEEHMRLTPEERYAIRWHMGLADVPSSCPYAVNDAFKKYPIAYALHCADMQASTFMEGSTDNNPGF